jgi:predicted amidophosphoribosyltransferase
MREIILRLKSGEEALGRRLGRACAGVFAKPDADALVPVPLHLKSRRGYNQSLAVAKGFGEVWGLEALDIARWSADFPTRMGMSGDERASLPEDAFVFAAHEPVRVALVDDVVTTGSTLLRLSQAAGRHGITVADAFAVAFAS